MITEVNENSFKNEVLDSDLPVIVDFWASWCGPCRMLGPVYEEISDDFTGRLKFAKLSTEESPGIAQEQMVTGIPCMIIFHKGKEVDRIVGFAPAPVLKQKIEAVLSKI